MEAARWLLVIFAAAAAGDDGVATFDPTSVLRVELLAHAAVVHLTSPTCKNKPCDGNWTLPVSSADLAVDASLRATVTFTGPARTWSIVPGAVTDSWWEVFFDLADVNATGFSYAFAARLDGASLVEVNRTTLGAGNWTVDPAHSEGGYIDAGVDLPLRRKAATFLAATCRRVSAGGRPSLRRRHGDQRREKDDGAKKSSGLRSTRKLFARWTGLRHAVKRTTKALVGPREPAREPPRILIDSTYAKRTKKAELEKLLKNEKRVTTSRRRQRTSKGRPRRRRGRRRDATVVIDAGSFLTRIGLTGEGEPRMVVASVVGRPARRPDASRAASAAGAAAHDCYVRPLYRNAYADWDAAELWRHALFATWQRGARAGRDT
ncbi:hypothetical protein JL722_15298 [Aureococcus anophagefferens]|nr:hypothetical protein JL722_15298 [Aureococcus anophagefferens]